jgi:hypothetical protein
MKTKLLKKLRKRYKWYYDRQQHSFVVIDDKEKSLKRYVFAYYFISGWISENFGIGSALKYLNRVEKRKDLVEYKKSIKHHFNMMNQLKNNKVADHLVKYSTEPNNRTPFKGLNAPKR